MSLTDQPTSIDTSAMQRVIDRLDRAGAEAFLSEISDAITQGGREPARVLHEWAVSVAFRCSVIPDDVSPGAWELDDIANSHGIDMAELRRRWADTGSPTATS